VATVSITPQLVWNLKQFAENLTVAETQMNSVERVRQFVNLPPEAPEISNYLEMPRKFSEFLGIPKDWPSSGKIELQKVKMRYREDRPLVLKGISATIEAREKIGIVGRTGKSIQSLLPYPLFLLPPSPTLLIPPLTT
jgi:ABC-type multidrug transport system fused ATPase/permease subunit